MNFFQVTYNILFDIQFNVEYSESDNAIKVEHYKKISEVHMFKNYFSFKSQCYISSHLFVLYHKTRQINLGLILFQTAFLACLCMSGLIYGVKNC